MQPAEGEWAHAPYRWYVLQRETGARNARQAAARERAAVDRAGGRMLPVMRFITDVSARFGVTLPRRLGMISLAVKTPKILFVNPRFPRSLWGFQGIHEIVGVRCGQAPLGLATVAGMTPLDFPVELQDENVETINLDTDADVVAIGCWNVQYHRAQELARSSAAAGRWSSWAGRIRRSARSGSRTGPSTWCSTARPRSPGREFCRDLRAGTPQARLQAGRQHRHAALPGAAVRSHPEGRLPLLLRPDDPRLPVRVRVLRHHHHRRPRAAR